METETPTLAMPKFRKYADGKRVFYLSKEPVTEDGDMFIPSNRWEADYTLQETAKAAGARDSVVRLPRLIDYWAGVEQNPRARRLILPNVAEYLLHLILPSGSRTATKEYVLKNEEGRTLRPSKRARVLNPTERHKEDGKEIVLATVYDLPFELRDGFYNGFENLDPESGFLKEAPKSEGPYGIRFGEQKRLYASFLCWGGGVGCVWRPSDSFYGVGFRGVSRGNLPRNLVERKTASR